MIDYEVSYFIHINPVERAQTPAYSPRISLMFPTNNPLKRSFIHPLHCLNLLLDNLQLLNHSLHSSNRRIHQQRIASRQANLLYSLQLITKQLDSLQMVVLFDLQRQRRVPASSFQRLRTGPIQGCRFRPSQPICHDEPRTSGTEHRSYPRSIPTLQTIHSPSTGIEGRYTPCFASTVQKARRGTA